MFTVSLSRSKFRYALAPLAPLLALATSSARAQSVPIPFASLLAGGGTVCSSSLPVYTVSGTGGAKYGDGCPAAQATISAPVAIASDTYGNVFIADQNDMLVRVVYNGGTALAAAIVAANPKVTGLTPQKGYIYTIAGGVTSTPTEGTHYCNQAGSGVIGYDTELDGCPGTESYQAPRGLAVDGDGNLFISNVASGSNLHILYVGGAKAAALITLENPTITTPLPGYVYDIAGTTGSSFTGDGALAIKATLNTPRGIFVDANENVYFADEFNNAIRLISSTNGNISTVAGHNAGSVSSCSGVAPAGDGSSATASTASLACPYGPWLDQYGNIFIAEAGNGTATSVPGRVRVVYKGGTLPGITSPTAGNIYTYAGGPPVTGGTATTGAQLTAFQEVFGVSLDPAGYLYITDFRTATTGSNHVWRVDPTNGNIAVIAGNSGTAVLTAGAHCNTGSTGPVTTDKYGDGCPATEAYLNTPQESLAFDGHGNVYLDDRANNIIRTLNYDNTFPATAVGSSVTQPLAYLYPAASLPITEAFTTQGASTTDYSDAGGDTCALNTSLTTATTCVDYVKFTPTLVGERPGSVTVSSAAATLATQALIGIGNAPALTIDPGTATTLGSAIQPLSVSTDTFGNVNITDGKSEQVLRTTIAGGATTAYITGLGTPHQTATDSYGNLFVADSTNNTIVERPVASATTIKLGTGLSAPQGVAADIFGNLFVADTGNNRIVYLSPITGDQSIVATSGFTLSAPTYLALDAAGDLFLIDSTNTRILEIPLGAMPQLIALPSGTVPTAIAFDPAGNTYIADKITGSILLLPVGSTTATPLVTSLNTPVGVAVTPSGNLFVADSAATSVAAYNRALNTTAFATTNIQLTSLPSTLTLGSIGNLAATLSTPPYAETGSAAAFPSSGTPTCTAAFVMAPGATCTRAFVFEPTVPGAQSATAIFSSTTGQSVSANFSGTATNLIFTNTALTLGGSGTVDYGQTATYTVTLTPTSTGAANPTGTITFIVDGKTSSTQTVSANPYIFPIVLTIGTHSIAANYSGDSIYAGSNASTSITVGKAVTTTTASYSQSASGITLGAVVTPTSTGAATFTGNVQFYVDGAVLATVPVGNGTVSATVLVADGPHTYYALYVGDANYATSSSTPQSFTVSRAATTLALTSTPVSSNGAAGLLLSAKLTTTGTGTPTGTVVFTNNGAMLGTVTLSGTGTATFTTTTTAFTSYSFTASYSGDGLFQPSTITITQGPDFAVIAPPAALAVPQGSQAVESITVAPINGYSGTLTAACTNLPVNSICRFQPIPLVVTSPASATLSVQVFVGINTNVASLSHPSFSRTSGTMLALLLFAPIAFGLRRRKGKARGVLPTLLGLALLTIIPVCLTGCGNKTPAQLPGSFTTPVGNTNVTLTLTDTNNVSRSTVFTVSVNSM
jgi:sugar lactone lactonase YvrE